MRMKRPMPQMVKPTAAQAARAQASAQIGGLRGMMQRPMQPQSEARPMGPQVVPPNTMGDRGLGDTGGPKMMQAGMGRMGPGMGGMGGLATNVRGPSQLPAGVTIPVSNKMKKGGKVSSASKRADGCAIKGKTKGRMV